MIVVSDAGPLIAFFDADAAEVLQLAYSQIIIPAAVANEVFHNRRVKPRWIKIQQLSEASDLALMSRLRQRHDPGEAEAVVLALRLGLPLLIDERAGTAVAGELSVEAITTIDTLRQLVANKTLKPPKAREITTRMRQAGVYLPDERFTA
jgi:predicted nucleic acid-binding protein